MGLGGRLAGGRAQGWPRRSKPYTADSPDDVGGAEVEEGDAGAVSPPGERLLGDGVVSGWKGVWMRNLMRVAIWSFFVERLVQSGIVGWGQSGRVGPVEQLGGKLLEMDPSNERWAETRAVARGIGIGRDTVHFNTERALPEMFTKVDCTEIRCPPPSPCVEEGGEGGGENPVLLFYEYAAPAFAHLRGMYGMSSSDYRRSFREGSTMIAHSSNSKSAQSFTFSEDGKYMLKTASEAELESMLLLLPRYAEHVSRRRGSLIARFHGTYRVSNPKTKMSTVYVASSNVFSTGKRLHERYDLKGSVIGRRASAPKSGLVKPSTMMKDLDLVDNSEGKSKIRLAAGCKKRLLAELTADADFLSGLGVMDYSLLVGIHRPNRPGAGKRRSVVAVPLGLLSAAAWPVWVFGCLVVGLVPGGARRGGRRSQVGVYPGREPGVVYYVGIIDVLQRYNLRKILERGAKGIVYNRHEISSVPPEEYRDRFIAFIGRSIE